MKRLWYAANILVFAISLTGCGVRVGDNDAIWADRRCYEAIPDWGSFDDTPKERQTFHLEYVPSLCDPDNCRMKKTGVCFASD